MSRWKSILGIFLVFALGAITGGLVVAGLARSRIENFIRSGPGEIAPLVVGRLSHELHLDEAQKAQLQTIMQQAQEELREIRQQVEPRVKSTMLETTNKIRGILKPEQKAKFEEVVREGEKRFGPLKP